ncbi:MAG: serine/threonine-protein kinase [Myxococcota bacterium]
MDPEIGPIKRFGRYTLIKKLATGGMAEIWLARQSGVAGFNRFVVIKKILSHLAEEETFRNMFLDEARMSAQLQHPNIVQVYDLGEADETYFIAMEFIMGENLAAIAWRGVKRASPLSPTFAARIMADACKALDYAHRLRGPDGKPLEIVHRDISPQNILVTYEGEVKVVDFGIAKAASKSQHTKTGMLKGKFSYMSPEQCLGNPVDKRSDVFALGIVLYELCTGKRLFKHESELMILEMITKRRITPPSEVAENIPAELEAIILKALEKDVEIRYQSAQDLQIALEDFIRAQSEASSNSDVAEYMRGLFEDKIEEKRKLIELASREDFLQQANFDDEATQQADRRGPPVKVVYGQPPRPRQTGQMMLPPNLGTPQASMPGMPMPQLDPRMTGLLMQQASLPGATSLPNVPAVEGSRVTQWIILATIPLILGAGGFIIYNLLHEGDVPAPPVVSNPSPTPREAPVRRELSDLDINSRPPGAKIFLNGEPVATTGTGQYATTNAQLTALEVGQTYRLKLELDGYESRTETFTVSKEVKRVDYELKPIAGKIYVDVAGQEGPEVAVLVDGREEGRGPKVELRHPAGEVTVEARLDRYNCTADPRRGTVPPGGSLRVTVRCTKGAAPQPYTPRQPNNPGDPRPTPTPSKPAAPGGCVPSEGLPPGFVTIETSPPSEIYYGNERLGETPLNKVKLPAGCVELVAKAKDPPKEKHIKLLVEPNKIHAYRVAFDP